MPDRHSEPIRSRGFDRRTLVRGTAWTVPAVAATAAAPAMAISGDKYTFTISGVGREGKSRSITLPARAHDITFSISGGGGGSYPSDAVDGMAGSGALLSGKIDLKGCGADQTIWMIAGGGGDQPTTPNTTTQATGYGNGGKGYNLALPAEPANTPFAFQGSYGGGGGAGSAILLGSAISGATPVIVAGGGGGDGVWGNSTTNVDKKPKPAVPVIPPTAKWVYDGGTAPGQNGGSVTTDYAPGRVTATGGRGTTGAAGGAGGVGSTTFTAHVQYAESKTGKTGGDHGTGMNGGGDGADYIVDSAGLYYRYDDKTVLHWLGIASGAGGGGWAGGGSGGIEIVDSKSIAAGGDYRYAIAGVGGSGGAGSNYVASSAGCMTPTVTAQGSARNAGSTNPAGTGAGGPGTVTITYYV